MAILLWVEPGIFHCTQLTLVCLKLFKPSVYLEHFVKPILLFPTYINLYEILRYIDHNIMYKYNLNSNQVTAYTNRVA